MSPLIEVIIFPSRESRAHIGVRPRKLCVHRLDGGCDCRRDVDEIASPGRLCRESWPHIPLGHSMLRRGTTSDHPVTMAEDVEYQPKSETNDVKGVDSIGP